MQENVLSLCSEYTDLSEEDQIFIKNYAAGLPAIAEISGADIFLDCLCRDGKSAVVVAEARRTDGHSLYQEDVVGKMAFPDNEPGVFRAFQTGKACRELRAVTQENVPVQQNAAPLYTESGKLAAVLIREQSIRDQLAKNRKYEEVTQTNQRLQETIASLEEQPSADAAERQYMAVQLREMSHRIKNNLQMLSSMMSMEARRCGNAEAETILNKNVARILTVASFHDMLTTLGAGSDVFVRPLIEKVTQCVRTCIPDDGCDIDFVITGSDLTVSAGMAAALMMAVNELLTNSARHAFPGRETGRIEIKMLENPPYRSILIADDGIGFDSDAGNVRSLGLSIVDATVRDKLKGVFSISSGMNGGVSARIDF